MLSPSPIFEIEGNFLIWEPNVKSPGKHRLIDSNRPQTTHFKYGILNINSGTISLAKKRHFLKFLVMFILTPIWGGFIIGLGVLIGSILGQRCQNYVAIILLAIAALVIWLFLFLIGKIIYPIQKNLTLARIANARLKHIQITRNNTVENTGMLGVDFTVVPGDFTESPSDPLSLKSVDAQRCCFVTFVALSRTDASELKKMLPKTQVSLTGKFNPDIPPQEAARWIASETNAEKKTFSFRPS